LPILINLLILYKYNFKNIDVFKEHLSPKTIENLIKKICSTIYENINIRKVTTIHLLCKGLCPFNSIVVHSVPFNVFSKIKFQASKDLKVVNKLEHICRFVGVISVNCMQ